METKVRFLAIRLQEYNQGYKDWHDRPFLFRVADNGLPLWRKERKFYHSDGLAWQPLDSDHAKIEKDYGLFDWSNDRYHYDENEIEAVDVLLVQFAQDWPPTGIKYGDDIPQEPSLGFVAPNGMFYPCDYQAHIGMAQWIHKAVLGSIGTDKDLLTAGWIQVNRGAIDLPDERDVTERQKTVLSTLYAQADEGGNALSFRDVPFKRSLGYALEELGLLELEWKTGELVTPGRKQACAAPTLLFLFGCILAEGAAVMAEHNVLY